ncbi:MAG: hypothetical protein K0V04_30435 [Deltaproteobacteria bacterium]|nr:hypothetical protein [Deltaproteobacteria bacterium]
MNATLVPLSIPGHTLPAALVREGLAATRAVVAPEGPWPPVARALAEAVLRKVGLALDADAIEPTAPEHTAAVVTDPVLGVQLIRLAIVAAIADGRPAIETVERVDRLAAAVGVETPALLDLRHIARGRHWRLRLHLMPRFWAVRAIRAYGKKAGWWAVVRMLGVIARLWRDETIMRRFAEFEALPPATLGRRFVEFLDGAGIPRPGTRGAAPWLIAYHDITHVLAGYGTDPSSEVLAASFQAGYRREDPFAIILFALCQFQLGIRMAPIATPTTGMLVPHRFVDAVCRGAAVTRDFTDGSWDLWAEMDDDLEEVRRRYNVQPPALPPATDAAA